jgi:CubicO group peptidase (beta-lactamase class C family)
MRNALLGAVIALCAAAPALAAQRRASPPAGWHRFVRAVDSFAVRDSIVGAGALLLRHGRIVGRHARGMADRELRQPVADETIHHWASITKTLTAVAIMQLRDRGLLSLDDRIVSYLPELRQVHASDGSIGDITIRMLLSHSSGFQDPTWPYGRGRSWEPFEPTRWEQLVAMMPYQELRFRPGSRYGYSNPAFIYLARVIEIVTGDPYQSYIHKNVWGPLGMTRSYFGVTPWHLASARGNSYTLRGDSAGRETIVAIGREFDPGITIPNGGWNAPLADVAAWAAFLLGAGAADTALDRRHDTVLARASLAEMWRPVVPLVQGEYGGSGSGGESMALSFFVRGSGDAVRVWHTGEQAGFRSLLLLDPRDRTAVVVVFNTTNGVRGRASQAGFEGIVRAALALLDR